MMYWRAFALCGLTLSLALGGCSGSSGDGDEPPDSEPQSPEAPPEEPVDPPPDESAVTLSVDDVTVDEGSGTVTFVIHAEGDVAGQDVRVDYATTDGSALAGTDYVEAAGTLMFSDDAEAVVEVQILDDAEPEGEETFNLELTNPLNAKIADAAAVAAIADDEEVDVCGEPAIAAADERAYLWKNCDTGTWRLRVMASEADLLYSGTVTAAEPFATVVAVGLEEGDVVDSAGETVVDFSLTTTAADSDGFNFVTAADAGTCFELTSPAGGTVLVGGAQVPRSGAFDLGTLESCDDDGSVGEGLGYNIVVVFTDDQRFDTLEHMTNVTTRLMPAGVNFENAYVPTPLCCPARASTYSGGFLTQNTGVLDNNAPNGGMAEFEDDHNIGARLQEAGYRTLFAGKWFNDYPRFAPYVPPGWDTFLGRNAWGNENWSNFSYILGSTTDSSGTGDAISADGQYNVYFESDQIVEFIGSTPAEQPYFVFWATTPPHDPATPDEADAAALADFTYRGRGFGEEDLSDKPGWVQDYASDPHRPQGDDEDVRNQLRTLLAVDRGLGSIIDAVEARGELEETVFVVMSDNGFMWGEHGIWAKNKAYEESIRVPLVMVVPGIAPRTDEHLVYAVLDVPVTLLEIAGVTVDSDGTSLLPLLRDPTTAWRNELFFEKFTIRRSVDSIWAGVRRDQWKYIEYVNGEAELYDLAADPFELENLVNHSAYADIRDSLRARMQEQLGLAIAPVFQDSNGQVGEPYSLVLEPWGGEPPLTWALESGELPPGLSLNTSTGEISGTPTSAGSWTFSVRVTDSAVEAQTGDPRSYIRPDVIIEIL